MLHFFNVRAGNYNGMFAVNITNCIIAAVTLLSLRFIKGNNFKNIENASKEYNTSTNNSNESYMYSKGNKSKTNGSKVLKNDGQHSNEKSFNYESASTRPTAMTEKAFTEE